MEKKKTKKKKIEGSGSPAKVIEVFDLEEKNYEFL